MAVAAQADAPSVRRALMVLFSVVLTLGAVFLALRWATGYAPLGLRALSVDPRDQRLAAFTASTGPFDPPGFRVSDPSPHRLRVNLTVHDDGSLPITVDGVATPFGPVKFRYDPDVTIFGVLAPHGLVEIPAHASRTVVLDVRT